MSLPTHDICHCSTVVPMTDARPVPRSAGELSDAPSGRFTVAATMPRTIPTVQEVPR